MSKKLLQINVNYNIPTEEFKAAWLHAAGPISRQPGLIWKIWCFAEDRKEGGGWYLFESMEHVRAYLDSDIVAAFKSNTALSNLSVKIFDIGEEASVITRAPIMDAIRA